jgi:alanyl-tRNA synthetase
VIGALGVSEEQAVEAIQRLQAETKKLSRDLAHLKLDRARGAPLREGGSAEASTSAAIQESAVGNVKVVTQRTTDFDKQGLRQLADAHRDRIKSGVVVLASTADDRVSIVVSVSKDLIPRVHAGQIVKEIAPIVGGGGGGRPDFADAGGKDSGRIDEMLAAAREAISRALGAGR